MNEKHEITTKRISPKTTLIFLDGKLAMVNSVVSEEYERLLTNAVDGMMEMVMQAGKEDAVKGNSNT